MDDLPIFKADELEGTLSQGLWTVERTHLGRSFGLRVSTEKFLLASHYICCYTRGSCSLSSPTTWEGGVGEQSRWRGQKNSLAHGRVLMEVCPRYLAL